MMSSLRLLSLLLTDMMSYIKKLHLSFFSVGAQVLVADTSSSAASPLKSSPSATFYLTVKLAE